MAFGVNDKDKDSLGAMQTAWDLGITHWDTDHACFIGFSEAKKQEMLSSLIPQPVLIISVFFHDPQNRSKIISVYIF